MRIVIIGAGYAGLVPEATEASHEMGAVASMRLGLPLASSA
jgi:hypothetical protein